MEAFEDWQHRLAACGSPSSENCYYFVLLDQFLGFLRENRGVGSAVFNYRLNLFSQHAAGRVHLVNRQQRGIFYRHFADGHRARQRMEHSYFYRRSIWHDAQGRSWARAATQQNPSGTTGEEPESADFERKAKFHFFYSL